MMIINAHNRFLVECRANFFMFRAIKITVVVVLKSFQFNVEFFSNGRGIDVWKFSDISHLAVLSLASKANDVVNLKISALAIDLVVSADDLVSGGFVKSTDRIARIALFDFIESALFARCQWLFQKTEKRELRVSARHPRA